MSMTRFICLATLLLAGPAALAHETKPYDRNGGHWDEAGNYHCHLAGCIPTVSRWQHRHVGLSNKEGDRYYLKEDWPHFLPISGCKTSRTVVLQNTSKVPVTWTNPRQCEIREGLWVDPYTGKEYKRAARLGIDLVIPPEYANAANGYQWDDNKRAQFANDILNMVPVGRDIVRRKRHRGISDWRPRNEYDCQYAQTWKDVSQKYDLDLFSSDKGRMNTILKGCGESRETIIDEPTK